MAMTSTQKKKPDGPCPICGEPAARDAFPFCSDRCREVDLGRWLKGSYAIPAGEAEDASGLGPQGDED